MKCGTVAVVGRANAGKSTLVNALVGEKVSIVSPKPQTTRDRIYGVLTTDKYQIVFEDTPGVYKASSLLNSRMQKTVDLTARDTDLILFVIDGHRRAYENRHNAQGKTSRRTCCGVRKRGCERSRSRVGEEEKKHARTFVGDFEISSRRRRGRIRI